MNIHVISCSWESVNIVSNELGEEDWHGDGEFRSKGWVPFGWLNLVKDGIDDVDLNPFEDVDADSVKRDPDQLHEFVPGPHDPVWDEPDDLDQELDDWPQELPEGYVD